MKVCIVTLYKTINCGSFLQAFALGEFLKSDGYHVCFLKLKYTAKVELRKYYSLISMTLKRGPRAGMRYISSLAEFKRCQNLLDFVRLNSDDLRSCDCVILGSDTIWNLESKNLCSMFDIFWGTVFQDIGLKSITYAGSVGNSSRELITSFPKVTDCVNAWKFISARDEKTEDILAGLTNKKIERVCDPTLLLTKTQYVKFFKHKKKPNKYIFFYLFQDLNSEQKADIIKWCHINNYRMISGTETGDFADETIVSSPFNFLEYMYCADYVVTDTYHGTVFSTNFEKQFVVIKRNKNKVSDFLFDVNLTDRMTDSKSISEILERQIHYEKINSKLEAERKHSSNFLKTSLDEVNYD